MILKVIEYIAAQIPHFLDPQIIVTATGSGPIGNGKALARI